MSQGCCSWLADCIVATSIIGRPNSCAACSSIHVWDAQVSISTKPVFVATDFPWVRRAFAAFCSMVTATCNTGPRMTSATAGASAINLPSGALFCAAIWLCRMGTEDSQHQRRRRKFELRFGWPPNEHVAQSVLRRRALQRFVHCVERADYLLSADYQNFPAVLLEEFMPVGIEVPAFYLEDRPESTPPCARLRLHKS
jgi:hypothetical protein